MLPLYDVDRPPRRGRLTLALIGANLVVFLCELLYTAGLNACLEGQIFYTYGLVPYSLISGARLALQCGTGSVYVAGQSSLVYATLLTSMFLHAGYLHIFGNMLFLFVFGPSIEARFGRYRYLVAYLACGVAGGLASTAVSSLVGPPAVYIPGVGASGAISGVMAAYLVLLPNSRIVSLVGYFIMPVRAFWFIGVWFVLQVLFQVGGVDTGVAYAAHIGGFMLGLGLASVVRAATKARAAEL